MKFILYLSIVAYFFEPFVNCRSVHTGTDTRSILEVLADKDENHDTESGGIFSWIRLKPILRREVQRIRNAQGATNKINQGSTEVTSLVPPKEIEPVLSGNEVVDTIEKNSLKEEPPTTDSLIIKSELAELQLNKNTDIESNLTGEFISNRTHVEMYDTDHPLVTNDFPDNVLFDILNQTVDSIFLQAMNDNSSIDSTEFDETTLLSEGGPIALLQEVSTIGFELLIDSETKQNLILTELINSQSNLIDDDDDLSDEDTNFVSIQFNYMNESNMQETVTNVELTVNPDVELNTDEIEAENPGFGSDEDETEDPSIGSNEGNTENRDIVSDEDQTETIKSYKTESIGSKENKTENTVFISDEDEIESIESGLDKGKTENIETSSSENKTESIEFSSDEEKTENSEPGSYENKAENIEFGSDENKAGNIEFDSENKAENIEFGSDEIKTVNFEFGSNENNSANIVFGSDENKTENTEFSSDENKTEKIEYGLDEKKTEKTELEEDKTENIELGLGENKTKDPEFSIDENKNVRNESKVSDSLQHENETEISTTEPEDPNCPDPGWCIFWFMALDLCAKDSHCHGTLLCCTIGCSKTCIDPDDELF